MQHAPTAKLPKKTSAKVNDVDNPAWTEGMLGTPILRRGRGLQASPDKVLASICLDADILEFSRHKAVASPLNRAQTEHKHSPTHPWAATPGYPVISVNAG